MAESPTLGQRLKSERERRRLTPRQVELGTKIKNAHLAQIEDDSVPQPNISLLMRLAQYYGIDFDELAELAGYDIPKISQLDEAHRQSIRMFIEAVFGDGSDNAG